MAKLANESFLWSASSSLSHVKSGVIGRRGEGGGKQAVVSKPLLDEEGVVKWRKKLRGGERERWRRNV